MRVAGIVAAAVKAIDCCGYWGWLARDPDVGAVVSGTGGVRKVRWSRPGSGKRGGVRVIYYNRHEREEIWLLLIYAKSARDNIPSQVLSSIRQEIER